MNKGAAMSDFYVVTCGTLDNGCFGRIVNEYTDGNNEFITLYIDGLRGWRTFNKKNCRKSFQEGDLVTLTDGERARVIRISDYSVCVGDVGGFKWVEASEIKDYNAIMEGYK